MNHTGRTIININGSTYTIKFGMGALLHFSETQGNDVQQTIEQLTTSGVNQIKAISKFMFSALYVDAIYHDKELDLTIMDIIDWIDSNPADEISKVMQVIIAGISAINKIDYPAAEGEESKKK